MARNRFDNLDPERREAMLAAAAHEFAERGYVGASLGRIIEAAGISKGLLYYYFNDKEDLFVTTVEVAMERLLDEAGGFSIEELSASTYWDALRRLGLQSVDLRSRDAWFVRLALAFPRLREEQEASDAVGPALGWARRLTERLLIRGQELGTVRRDLPLSLLVELTLAVDEAGDRWFAEHHREYDEAGVRKLVEARIDLVRDMLDAEHEGWNR
jgi:AcrR family transcriptional regulator